MLRAKKERLSVFAVWELGRIRPYPLWFVSYQGEQIGFIFCAKRPVRSGYLRLLPKRSDKVL